MSCIRRHCPLKHKDRHTLYPSIFIVGLHIRGLVRDCSNSIVLAMELPQSCPKPSILYERNMISYQFLISEIGIRQNVSFVQFTIATVRCFIRLLQNVRLPFTISNTVDEGLYLSQKTPVPFGKTCSKGKNLYNLLSECFILMVSNCNTN